MKVSIIIPCYNVEKYIDRCLNSVYSQTIGVDALEIILIDDCSRDNTIDKLRAFEEKYPESTILIPLESNVGAAEARNIGLSYASGEYIAFADADDMLADSLIEKMVLCIEEQDCEMVECAYSGFSDISECHVVTVGEQQRYNLEDPFVRRDYIRNIGIKSAVWGRLYRSTFLKRTGLSFVKGSIYEDVQFTGVGMFLLNSVCQIPETLYFYYSNDSGISGSSTREKLKQEVDIIRIMIRELEDRGLLEDILEQFYPELEYYCIRKSYLDPISALVINRQPVTEEDLMYYRESLLEAFPNAGKNKYALCAVENNSLWSSMFNLLVV